MALAALLTLLVVSFKDADAGNSPHPGGGAAH
jgi:hypothetical protein